MAQPANTLPEVFSQNLSTLQALILQLPLTVASAKKNNCNTEVFTSIPTPVGPDADLETLYMVLNHRLDALFGEDVHDENGRLPNVKQGKHGMDQLLGYIKAAADRGYLQWEAANIKIERLITEVKHLIAHPPPALKSHFFMSSLPQKKKKIDSSTSAIVVESGSESGESDIDLGKSKKQKLVPKDKTKPTPWSKGKAKIHKPKKVKHTTAPPSATSDTELDHIEGHQMQVSNIILILYQLRRGQNSSGHFGASTVHYKLQKFPWTVDGPDVVFNDEPKLPPLNNLATHYNACKKKPDLDNRDNQWEDVVEEKDSEESKLEKSHHLLAAYLEKGKLNPALKVTYSGFLRFFTAWILEENLPWTTGKSPALRLLFKYLKIPFSLLTDSTVRNQLDKFHDELHAKVVKEFAAVKSKIAYSTDTWTMAQMIHTFACMIATYINETGNWLRGLSTSRFLKARIIMVITQSSNSSFPHLISITTDNASTNDILVDTVSSKMKSLYNIEPSSHRHIRCFAHVINLVVQAILHLLKEANDPNSHNDFPINKDLPIYYNPTANEDESHEDLNIEVEGDDGSDDDWEDEEVILSDKVACGSAVKKLQTIFNKVVSSPQCHLHFRKISVSKYGSEDCCAKLMPIRDVRTRWNFTLAMIVHALLFCQAIDTWVFEHPELESLKLRRDEWKFLEVLGEMLEAFFACNITNVNIINAHPPFVLPQYIALEQHLQTFIHKSTASHLPKQLRTAAMKGREKLLKYKAIAEWNDYVILTTVLHPALRAEWFKKTVLNADSPADQATKEHAAVRKAEDLLCEAAEIYFQEQQCQTPRSQPQTTPPPAENTAPANILTGASISRANSWMSNHLEDEITRYFDFEGESCELQKLLKWWKKHESSFPTLAKMACDILPIPATSVSVEQTFSKSCHLCTDL
ncbi:hypothetical protein NP233_g11365 [Leucocoprinus birnbaumii]|uniref:HAT C-terminal dimerisation domain-containing protein n=1 Tax=Leucocoprinus birnbaumii TaxID=56174 RepID=A0AAD5YLC5_9AGAR|nr:hypothetical protein NP233_g11365 [Leucocoprinus birnbaumii]